MLAKKKKERRKTHIPNIESRYRLRQHCYSFIPLFLEKLLHIVIDQAFPMDQHDPSLIAWLVDENVVEIGKPQLPHTRYPECQ
jgi:hypothetical protein